VVVSGESVGEHREMQQAEDEANGWCWASGMVNFVGN
jgi:hypothetical protein